MRARKGRFQAAALSGAAVLALYLVQSLEAAPLNPPLPPPRPDRVLAPEPPPEPPKSPELREEEQAGGEADGCFARLAELGVKFERTADKAERSCAARNVVTVSELPGALAVSPPSPMVCAAAEALARWSGEVIVPKAEEHLQESPGKLKIGTSYECRNQRSGGKLSEHAFGNAVDLMGFEFGKRSPLPVAAHASGSAEQKFLDEIRRGACGFFTTVLGPGSDAAHADHLHLDLRARKAGYRICQ